MFPINCGFGFSANNFPSEKICHNEITTGDVCFDAILSYQNRIFKKILRLCPVMFSLDVQNSSKHLITHFVSTETIRWSKVRMSVTVCVNIHLDHVRGIKYVCV